MNLQAARPFPLAPEITLYENLGKTSYNTMQPFRRSIANPRGDI
jgi:hypothetical protein